MSPTAALRFGGWLGEMLNVMLEPWYDSLADPPRAQREVLESLVGGYAKTDYGRRHGASHVGSVDEFRRRFPVVDYAGLLPYVDRVASGDHAALLPEPPAAWVMTRGTTGKPKIMPVTRRHLEQILRCGARVLLNFVNRRGDAGLLRGRMLNLHFPSAIGKVGGMDYGYSSGTYARINSRLGLLGLVPEQEEIDALGSGITRRDWDRRFELVYRSAREEDVRWSMGVSPVLTSFARYVRREHGVWPADLWKFNALFATSVAKIHVRYEPAFQRMYGPVPVMEVYSATEGVFAQQLDDYPYVTPNYDTYFLEAATSRGFKMLHEMRRGEWGKMVVSSCLFPRYDMGDIVECLGPNYFRIFGRARPAKLAEYRLKRLVTRWVI